MSADNSICILQSRGKDGRPEYRVAHVQAVENATDDSYPEYRDEYLRSEFGKRVVYRRRSKAFKEASRLYDEVCTDFFVEYGIVSVNIGREFPVRRNPVETPKVRNGGSFVAGPDDVVVQPWEVPTVPEFAQATPGERKKKRRQSRLQRKVTRLTHEVRWLSHRVKELEGKVASH